MDAIFWPIQFSLSIITFRTKAFENWFFCKKITKNFYCLVPELKPKKSINEKIKTKQIYYEFEWYVSKTSFFNFYIFY